jgi:hypothetical protein
MVGCSDLGLMKVKSDRVKRCGNGKVVTRLGSIDSTKASGDLLAHF